MTNRRDFLKNAAAASGVVFAGCSMLGNRMSAQQASAASPKRRQAMVGGRRIRTIDMHAHVIVPEAMIMAGRKIEPDNGNIITGKMAEERFTKMDKWGIDMQALSLQPFWYDLDRDRVEPVIKLQNEKLAELVAKYPDRFVAFATTAMQFPDLAAQQLEEGMKKYNLRGTAISGHLGGDEFANPKYDVFWRKAEELGAVVFMHPQAIPEMEKRFAGKGNLGNTIGNPLETTVFLSHLIYEGTLDKFPGLKLCCAHAGGYLPSYIARSDYACFRAPEQCKTLKKKPSEYLRQLYFDSMVFTPEGLRHLVAECGVSQIVIGTDYPFPWSETTVDHVLTTPGLTDKDKRAILGENAAKLLKIT